MSREPPSPWPMLVVVGILCGVALGALVALFRRQNELRLLPQHAGADDDFEPRVALPPFTPAPVLPPGPTIKPIARTVTVASRTPTMLLQAIGERQWDVWVRVVSPPGSFADFSLGVSKDMVRIPAGGVQRMRVPCGEFLLARGSVPNVNVSVSGGPT